MRGDDGSSSSDESESGYSTGRSSLHASSSSSFGPAMGGKGPGGQPDWMNRFQKPTTTGSSHDARKANNSPTLDWMNKLNTSKSGSMIASSAKNSIPDDSSSRGQPEWLKKFEKIKNGEGRSQSPPRSGTTTVPGLAPSTPSWVKQFRNSAGTVAGQPQAAAIALPRLPLDDSQDETSRSRRGKNPTARNDHWKKLLKKTSDDSKEEESTKQAVPPAASETPQWMKKFTKGLPTAPPMDVDESDDDEESLNASITIEPTWMSQFNKVKAGAASPRKGAPPPVEKKSDQPEWMQKFQQRQGGNSWGVLESPMKKNELGIASVNNDSFVGRIRGNFSRGGPGPSPSQSSSRVLNNSNSSLSGSNSVVFNEPIGKSLSNKGLASAPSSPITTPGKTANIGTGGFSAPSSPVGGAGSILRPALGFKTTHVRSNQSHQNNLSSSIVVVKEVDPAAVGPEKPAWVSKVKAAAHTRKDEPSWLQKLKEKNQGIEPQKQDNTTPPWKRKERLKEEQAKKLREELAASTNYDGAVREDNPSSSNGKVDDRDKRDDNDELQEDDNIPEWMRQFKKMHIREAEVLSAQGRAPQGVSLLRHGGASMIERSNRYDPDMEHAKALPADIFSPQKMGKEKLDFSKPKVDDQANSSNSVAENDEPTARVREKKSSSKRAHKWKNLVMSSEPVKQAKAKNEEETAVPPANNEKLKEDSSHGGDYTTQIEIDNSKPTNVMGMWGKTIKAKKPGNSTLMSFRMIQNQAERVRERIAKAKQQNGEDADNSDEESMKGIDEINVTKTASHDNSAAALFGFGGGGGGKMNDASLSMDNSAAALFGVGGGGGDGRNNHASASLHNSAAALFGFGGGDGNDGKEKVSSDSVDNSAAALFGVTGVDAKKDVAGVSMDNSAAALFGKTNRQSIVEEDSDDGSSNPSELNKASTNKKCSLDDSGSDSDSSTHDEKPRKPEPAPVKTNSSLDDSDSDSDSDSDNDDSSDEKGKAQAPMPPPAKKNTFHDDSDSNSDDSDDGGKRTSRIPPVPIQSLPNDSNSEDSNKNETTKAPASAQALELAPKKVSNSDNDSDDSSGDQKSKPSASAPAPMVTPKKKKSFFDESESDSSDSSDEEKEMPPAPVLASVSKLSLGDSSSENDHSSDDEKPKKPPAPTMQTKSSADDSSSDKSDRKSKHLVMAPAPAPKKSSELSDSDSDDSSDDEAPAAVSVPELSRKKSSRDKSDSSSDSKSDYIMREKKKSLVPADEGSSSTANAKASAKKMSFLDGSDDESSEDEKPKKPITLEKPAYQQSPAKIDSPARHSSAAINQRDNATAISPPLSSSEDVERKTKEPEVEQLNLSSETVEETTMTTKRGEEEKKAESTKSVHNNETDEDAAWQAALEELEREEKAKQEREHQLAWEAALEGLAAEESKKKEDVSKWDTALEDLASEMESSKDEKTRDKAGIKKKKEKKSGSKDKGSNEKRDKNTAKSPKGKKTKTAAETEESSPFDPVSSNSDPSPFAPVTKDSQADPSPFAPLKQNKDASPFAPLKPSKDASPFVPIGQTQAASPFDPVNQSSHESNPFAPLNASQSASPFAPVNDPFAPVGCHSGFDDPFAPIGDPFAPLNDTDKKKSKSSKDKFSPRPGKAKSTMKLVVQTAKPKTSVKHTKKAGGDGFAESFGSFGSFGGKPKSDEDSFEPMDDFDDDFSVKNDFGDFAEDGSVVPLKAVRNLSSKDKKKSLPNKVSLSSHKKGKPNALEKKPSKTESKGKEREKDKDKKKEKDKEKKKDKDKKKDKKKDKSRSRSISASRSPGRSRDMHKRSRSRGQGKSRSKSRDMEKTRRTDRSRGRSSRRKKD